MRSESCRAPDDNDTAPELPFIESPAPPPDTVPIRHSGTRGPYRPTRRQIDITDADLVVAVAEPFRCRCACPAAVAASFGVIVLFMFSLLLAVPPLLVTLP